MIGDVARALCDPRRRQHRWHRGGIRRPATGTRWYLTVITVMRLVQSIAGRCESAAGGGDTQPVTSTSSTRLLYHGGQSADLEQISIVSSNATPSQVTYGSGLATANGPRIVPGMILTLQQKNNSIKKKHCLHSIISREIILLCLLWTTNEKRGLPNNAEVCVFEMKRPHFSTWQ